VVVGNEVVRCEWANGSDLYAAYHDDEWGVPCHDDQQLFELLLLEGFQAGLSWITILRKRPAFREAFHHFDPVRIAAYTDEDAARLMADSGIVRNRLKIESSITNAQAFLQTQQEFDSFDAYIWQFAPPPGPRPRSLSEVPASTAESDAMSKALKKRGFRFVGSTICYAFMQSAGLVDDHVVGCFRATSS
jgi:DNA-3-methyladenine glycosylase I